MLYEESGDMALSSVSGLPSADLLPRTGRLNMRGSAAATLNTVGKLSPEATALAFVQSDDIATQLQYLDRARLDMEKSLNELNLILNGDSDSLKSLSITNGLHEQAVDEILQYINTDIGLAQDVDNLNVMIRNEIQPMLTDVYSMLEEHVPESERRLKGIFEHKSGIARETFAPSSSPRGGSSSQPPVRPEDYAKEYPPGGFEFLQGKSPKVENLLKKMLKETHTTLQFDPTNRSPGGIGTFGRHHHRRRHGSVERRRQHAKRRLEQTGLQDALATCPASCDNIENDVDRKACNCADLFKCVDALKDTDMAVLMSRGLVDRDTGTIEVEKADLSNERLWAAGANGESLFDENGRLQTQSNNALNDVFDAGQFLAKINRIRGLSMQEKCDELLDEFHVPCRDWQDGCSGSDGRSYRLVSISLEGALHGMLLLLINHGAQCQTTILSLSFFVDLESTQTIDEICDAIDSPEPITFASMSEAFDGESTRQESCDANDYLPSEQELLKAGTKGVKNFFNSFAYGITTASINSSLGNGEQIFIRDNYDAATSPLGGNPQPIGLTNFARSQGVIVGQSNTCSSLEAATKAIDGSVATSSCTTNDSGGVFWEVDLGRIRNIAYVKIYSRRSLVNCGNCEILKPGIKLTFSDGDPVNDRPMIMVSYPNRPDVGAAYFFPRPRTKARFIRISQDDDRILQTGRIDLGEVEVMGWEETEFIQKVREIADAKFKDEAVPNVDDENVFVQNCFAAADDAAAAAACNPFTSSRLHTVITGDSFRINVSTPNWDNDNNEFRLESRFDAWDFNGAWINRHVETISLGDIITPGYVKLAIDGAMQTKIESNVKVQVEECYKRECKLDTKVSKIGAISLFALMT